MPVPRAPVRRLPQTSCLLSRWAVQWTSSRSIHGLLGSSFQCTFPLQKPDNCLNLDKMKVSDGGKQPFMQASVEQKAAEDDSG